MATATQLQRVGLEENSAVIYLALLKNGRMSVQDIARVCEMKRSTLYPLLERMLADELVGVEMRGKRRKFFAQNPERLLEHKREERRSLEALMPELESLYREKEAGGQVQVLNTPSGLRRAMEEMMTMDPREELLTIEGGFDDALKVGFDFWKHLLTLKKKRRISSRTIIPFKERGDFILRDHSVAIRTSRLLTDFHIGIYLYGKTVMLTNPAESQCYVIENQRTNKALCQVFEALWQRAKAI